MDSMQCHLVYLTGTRAGEARSFNAGRITIGRSSTCDLQFDPYNDLMVAAQHAEILLDEETFFIHDLNTRGGTYVNGERIDERHPLRHEDYLRFGKNGPEVIFRKGIAPAGRQELPPETPETAELEFLSGADAGKIFPVLSGRSTRVGRRSDVEISLDPRGDMVVSGNHCTVSYEGDRFVLYDSSRNGTFLNGQQVNGSTVLKDGDIITLGEGGPRARFTVHPPRRTYPNLTGAFPRVKVPEEVAERREKEVREANRRELGLDEPTNADDDLDEIITPRDNEAVAATVAGPGKGKRAATLASSALAHASRLIAGGYHRALAMSSRQWLIIGVGAIVLVVLVLIIVMASGDKQTTGVTPENYAREVRNGKVMRSTAGQYTIRLPQGWASRENGPFYSIESSDKRINVDYVRDPKLSADKVRQILTQNGASVTALPPKREGSVSLNAFSATQGNRRSYAVLHAPTGDVPALAIVEAPADAFEKLPQETINSLAVANLKLQRLAPSPQPSPTVAAASPARTNVPTAAPPGSPTPAATQVAQATTPSVTPLATATPALSPAAVPEVSPTPAGSQPVANRSLGLTLVPPAEWSASANEETGVTTLRSPDGINVRIARDAEKMEARAVFEAMQGEGWQVVMTAGGEGRQPVPSINYDYEVKGTPRRFSVAEMQKDDSRLVLLLMDQADNSTLLMYATRKGEFTREHRLAIANLVQQMATAQAR